MFDSVAFIGAGRVARIILGGWQRAGRLPAVIVAYDANPQAVQALQAQFPGVKAGALADAAGAHLVFAALPPPAMAEMLGAIAGHLRADAVLCSLAPKVKLAALGERLGGFARLARMNPNAPAIVGKGYNPIAFGAGLPPAERAALGSLLAPLGESPQVAEELLEAYAVISAMGPTYFGFQFAEVERLALSFGLDAGAASAAMRAMVQGTAQMLFGGELPQASALDLVPVRPMAEHEEAIRQMLRTQIGGVFARLTS